MGENDFADLEDIEDSDGGFYVSGEYYLFDTDDFELIMKIIV
jgi:hypothetical protein